MRETIQNANGKQFHAVSLSGGKDSTAMLLLMIEQDTTSIDAFAVGITLSALNVKIIPSATLIGTTTFLIAFVGVWIGHFFGNRLGNRAGILGGVILILIGVRIFIMG